MEISLFLWKEICESLEILCDVRQYLIFHFILPFEKAERERVRVNEIYDAVITVNDIGRFVANPIMTEYKPSIEELLKDSSLDFNPYIGDAQRIERLIIIMHHTWLIHEEAHHLEFVKKGLLTDNMIAFRILYNHEFLDQCEGVREFIERVSKRLLTLPTWQNHMQHIMYYDIYILTRYCLEKELYHIVLNFVGEAPKKGIDLYADEHYFRDILTEAQHSRLSCFKQEYMCSQLIDQVFKQALNKK